MSKKKVIIIGAGPGGLTTGMILANKGFDVKIYEKRDIVGGRNGFISAGEYTFDIGPTFFLMKDVLEDIFKQCGRKLGDYVEVIPLDPMYKLAFKNLTFHPSTDKNKMMAEMESIFPGSSKDYERYLKYEQKKYDKLLPCLEVPYGKLTDYLSKNLLKALPYLDLNKSLYDVLGKYYNSPELRLSFTFQAKYIGMSPWEAPGLFSMISFIEHGGGVYHITGGLNRLSAAMAKIIEEDKGSILLNSAVKELIIENKAVKGVVLENGEEDFADYVVINADFAHAMTNLSDNGKRKKYTDEKISKMKYSCSTFMLYLGLDKVYDHLEHHNIFFADDYEKNVKEISGNKVISEDPSFYIQNPSVIDKTLAPEGKSSIYVLVPTGNLSGGINWNENKDYYTEKMLGLLENKAGLKDLRKHIEELRIITPQDWADKMDVYNGATFNLSHNLGQMLYMRPHNKFEEFENCYLVGGGTHPGSGLPTIYESGRISAGLIVDTAKGAV